MLQRDYILEIVAEFTESVARAFKLAVEKKDEKACADIEQQIGELLDLDHETALALAPDSLVTMMVLSGMGDSVASYVCWSLDRLARVYEDMGNEDLAGARRLQAKAVAESFNCDPADVPAELDEVDAQLFSAKAE